MQLVGSQKCFAIAPGASSYVRSGQDERSDCAASFGGSLDDEIEYEEKPTPNVTTDAFCSVTAVSYFDGCSTGRTNVVDAVNVHR